MNDLFEVKRYWSDSPDEEFSSDAKPKRISNNKEQSNSQETDILKKLKAKVATKTNSITTETKTQQKVTLTDANKNETNVGDEEGVSKGKKKKKRKRAKNLKISEDTSEEVNKKGGFPVLGENLADQWKKKKLRRSLPSWLANPDVISVDLSDQKMTVESLKGLDESTISNLKKNHIDHFFPVQRQVIPYMLANDPKSIYPPHDVCVSAPTGSGKTIAYVLPIVQALRQRLVPQVRALIILPVQDLAYQVFRVVRQYCEGTSLKAKLLSGQQSFTQEQVDLIKPNLVGGYHCLVDIIVATPGRIVDHIRKTKGFQLKFLRFLIIDEADRIMEDIQNDWLAHVETSVYSDGRERPGPLTVAEIKKRKLPLQKLLFSATLSQNPEKLEKMNLFEPKLFTSVVQPKDIIKSANPDDKNDNSCAPINADKTTGEFIGKYTIPAELTEVVTKCSDPQLKPLVLHHLVISKQMKKALVFTKSTEHSHKLAVMMQKFGLSVGELSSKIQHKRSTVLTHFTRGKIDILICTDALARGMDIGQIDYVVSYDCPKFIKTYIHRVGRTARAGDSGCAITILTGKSEDKQFASLMKDAGRSANSHPKEDLIDESKLDVDTYEKVKELTLNALKEEQRTMPESVALQRHKKAKYTH